MEEKFKHAFMDVAIRFSQLSSAIRLKVGAIIVKDNRIISLGYNGTPSGWDNNCEDKVYIDHEAAAWLDIDTVKSQWPYEDEKGRYALKTKPEVLHAERNALDKLARGNEGGLGSSIFVTHAPCLECAKSIYSAGISNVYFKHDYSTDAGMEFLKNCGIKVERLNYDE